MSIEKHVKGKIAIGMGIIVSLLLLAKLYLWLYDALLKSVLRYIVNGLLPYLPISEHLGVPTLYALGIILLFTSFLIIAYFLGSLTGTFIGKSFKRTVGRLVSKLPGYGMLSKVVKNFIDGGGTKQFNRFGVAYLDEPGVSDAESPSMPVIITGETQTHFSVMTPSAPTPMSGFMYFFPKDRVCELDIDATEFFSYVVGMGAGSLAMLNKSRKRDRHSP